jgi:hypothetical protein
MVLAVKDTLSISVVHHVGEVLGIWRNGRNMAKSEYGEVGRHHLNCILKPSMRFSTEMEITEIPLWCPKIFSVKMYP